MKVVEIRRHAPAKASKLTEEGREICSRAKQSLEFRYDLFYSSPKPRAVNTLRALGGRDIKEDPRLGTLPGDELERFDHRVEAFMEERGVGLLEAYFALDETRPYLKRKGEEILQTSGEIAARLPDGGRALCVSHGGSIEPAAILALGGSFDLSRIGGPLSYCEGVALHFINDKIQRVDIIRLVE